VLTSPVITVPAGTMVAEVIALMFERGSITCRWSMGPDRSWAW
jgi:hypothetical protein